MKHHSAQRIPFAFGLIALASAFTRSAQAEGSSSTVSDSPALVRTNTLTGATGQLRIIAADSGKTNTFRLSATEGLYAGTGFLCPNCASADGTVSNQADSASMSQTRFQLSLSPVSFLEGFAAVNFQSTLNDQSSPRIIQTGGNTDLGIKLFTPYRAGRVWSLGALSDLSLMAMTHSVGVVTANLDFAALGTLDLRELANDAKVPLRLHLNGTYRFDNSWKTGQAIERTHTAELGSYHRLTRIERLGFSVRRSDMVRLGFGAEGAFARYRPFAEWSIDLPVTRQNHICRPWRLSPGDACLSRTREFAAMPSRLSLGIRALPFSSPVLSPLGIHAAIDLGTGGTSKFVEESIPELPWMIHFGLSYSVDATPRIERVVQVKETKPVIPEEEPELYIAGQVFENVPNATESRGIPNALVFPQDVSGAGLIADSEGRFRFGELKPGDYSFRVLKDDFAPAECKATVPPALKRAVRTTEPPEPRRRIATNITCQLTRLPTSAIVTGVLRDADTTVFVPHATVTVSDARGRKVTLTTDEFGSFRFENVPQGAVRIATEAEGYLSNAMQLQVKARENAAIQLTLHKRPKLTNVTVTQKELKLKRQIHFLHDSAEILLDSFGLIEELADALRSHPSITSVEIQGHTDDTGTPEHNLTLSKSRASAVLEALALLGIPREHLSAAGYGSTKPLVQNTSAANRAKNRRVQFMILSQ